MKKRIVAVVALLLIIVISLIGCTLEPIEYHFNYEELSGKIERVELLNYINDSPKDVKDKKDMILPYDNSLETVIETLEEEKNDEFALALSEQMFFDYYDMPHCANAPYGISIKITYSDNNFLVLSCTKKDKIVYGFVVEFNADGEPIRPVCSYARPSYFGILVNDFFTTKISY